jgi:hypothetical protein
LSNVTVPTDIIGSTSIKRLRRSDEQRFVDSVAARIPTWKAGLLTNAGRTTLTKTTLSAIPVHVSICCRAFLWSGTERMSGGKCKIAWPLVCAPNEYGGLGITDLRILGFALRLRWEWLRRTDPESARARLPSKPERIVSSMFQA